MTRHAVGRRPSVAVVGAGVSGLTAAYVLSRTHDVTLFEADDRLGGHAHTHDVADRRRAVGAVDSGFIVHNDRTYPLLLRLFAELGVRHPAHRDEHEHHLRRVRAGLRRRPRHAAASSRSRRRVARPALLAACSARSAGSTRRARGAARRTGPTATLTYGEFLERHGFGEHFVTHYALPLVSCVWSWGAGRRWLPGARTCSRSSTTTACSVLGTPHLAHGGRRLRVVRRARWPSGSTGARASPAVTAVSRKPDDGVEIRATRRRPSRLRPGRHRHPRRRGACAAGRRRRDDEQEVLGAFGYSQQRAPCCTATTPCCRPRAAPGRAGTTGWLPAPVRRRTALVSLLDEPAAGHPRARPAGRHAQPGRARRARRRCVATMTYRAPDLHRRRRSPRQHRLPAAEQPTGSRSPAPTTGWGFHEDGCRSGVAAAEALGAAW